MSISSPWLFEALPMTAAVAAPCRCGGCRGRAAESEWEIASVCPPPGEVIPFRLKGFTRYGESLKSLRPGDREKVEAIARSIVLSFRPGCQPIRLVRIEGHADRDPERERREPGFERQISERRAVAVRNAVIEAIGDPAIVRQVTMTVAGFGSSRLLAANPVTEAQRQENRRVDVLLTVSTPTPPVPPPSPPNPERCKQCVEDFLNSRLEGNEKIARLQACLASNRCR